jgi:ribonuclease-3
MSAELRDFIRDRLGFETENLALFERALTHPSLGPDNYQRLEFLGDRVLGLVMAEWLSERFPGEQEGTLSHRFTKLVSRACCARVAADIGLIEHIRLGKSAWDSGVARSENVLGDALEAVIAALFLQGGLDAARAFIRRCWAELIDEQGTAPRHPKSLLLEWAEAQRRKSPVYTVIDRSGPDHALRFTVRVSVANVGEATGAGNSKQEAETAAAQALLEQLR